MTSNYISKLIENLNYEESFKNKKIQTINIVLDSEDYNFLADLNEDGINNILDIVSLVNLVLSP